MIGCNVHYYRFRLSTFQFSNLLCPPTVIISFYIVWSYCYTFNLSNIVGGAHHRVISLNQAINLSEIDDACITFCIFFVVPHFSISSQPVIKSPIFFLRTSSSSQIHIAISKPTITILTWWKQRKDVRRPQKGSRELRLAPKQWH